MRFTEKTREEPRRLPLPIGISDYRVAIPNKEIRKQVEEWLLDVPTTALSVACVSRKTISEYRV